MLKSQLRNCGKSYLPDDLEIVVPQPQVPDDIPQRLSHEHGDTVKGRRQPSNDLVREEVQIADIETLLLTPRVRFAQLSLENGVLCYIYPIGKYLRIIEAVKYVNMERSVMGEGLYIISDEKGEIKFKVKFGRGQKDLENVRKGWRWYDA